MSTDLITRAAALLGRVRGHLDEIPEAAGVLLWARQSGELVKGAGHKYVRRVKGANGKWRYFYDVTGGHGAAHHAEIHLGAKFKVEHEGKAGHYEVTKEDGGWVTIRHDETGHEAKVKKTTVQTMIKRQHAELFAAHRERTARDVKAAKKYGASAKQKARLAAHAKKYGHHDLANELTDTAAPDHAGEYGRHAERARHHHDEASKATPGTPEHKKHRAASLAHEKAREAHSRAIGDTEASAGAFEASKAADALTVEHPEVHAARRALEAHERKRQQVSDRMYRRTKAGSVSTGARAAYDLKMGQLVEQEGHLRAALAAAEDKAKRGPDGELTTDELAQRRAAAEASALKRRGTGKPDEPDNVVQFPKPEPKPEPESTRPDPALLAPLADKLVSQLLPGMKGHAKRAELLAIAAEHLANMVGQEPSEETAQALAAALTTKARELSASNVVRLGGLGGRKTKQEKAEAWMRDAAAKQRAGLRDGKPGHRIHYTGDRANSPRNGEVIAAFPGHYRVKWDDGTEGNVERIGVRGWDNAGARFHWEDENPSGDRSPEAIEEGKRQAVAHREAADKVAAAEKAEQDRKHAGWHKPADRTEASKRLKAALQKLYPDGQWSVTGGKGTGYGWLSINGTSEAEGKLRDEHRIITSVSSGSRDSTVRDLEEASGIFTPGEGLAPGSVARKHADKAAAEAARREGAGTTRHVGQVVTIGSNRRRYVVVSSEQVGSSPPRYNLSALSGGMRGSGPSSVSADDLIPHADQRITFDGAQAADRRARALRSLALNSNADPDTKQRVRLAASSGGAVLSPAELAQRKAAADAAALKRTKAPEVPPVKPPVKPPQSDSGRSDADKPSPQPAAQRPAGFSAPVAFTGETRESVTKKRGNTVWSVPHAGSIPDAQFTAMKDAAREQKGYYLRGQGFTFRDPEHARQFVAAWGAGDGAVPTTTPDADGKRRARADRAKKRTKPDGFDAAEGAGEGWRRKRDALTGTEGKVARVVITQNPNGTHSATVHGRKLEGEHRFPYDAGKAAAAELGRLQAIRNADRNREIARRQASKLGLVRAEAPPAPPATIQPTRDETEPAMTARHAAEIQAIEDGELKPSEKFDARRDAKVRHEVEAFEAGHRWQDPAKVRETHAKATRRGFNTWGGRRQAGWKHHGMETERAALPKIMERHRAHEKAQRAHQRATGSAASRLTALYNHLTNGGAWRDSAPEVGEVVKHRNDTNEVKTVGSRNARVGGRLRGHRELGMPHAEGLAAVISSATDDDLSELSAGHAQHGGLQSQGSPGLSPYGFGMEAASAEVERRQKAGTWAPSSEAPAPRTVAALNTAREAIKAARKARNDASDRRTEGRQKLAGEHLAKIGATRAPAPKRTSRPKAAAEAYAADYGRDARIDHHAERVSVVRTTGWDGKTPSWHVVEHHHDGTHTRHADSAIDRKRDALAYAEDVRKTRKAAGAPTDAHLAIAADLDHLARHVDNAQYEVPEHLHGALDARDFKERGVAHSDAWREAHPRGTNPLGLERHNDATYMRELAHKLRSGMSGNTQVIGGEIHGGPGVLARHEGGYAKARAKAVADNADRPEQHRAGNYGHVVGHNRSARVADRAQVMHDAEKHLGKWRAIMHDPTTPAGDLHEPEQGTANHAMRVANSDAHRKAYRNGYTFERGGLPAEGVERDYHEALTGMDNYARKRAVEAMKSTGVRPVPHGHFHTAQSKAPGVPLAKAYPPALMRPLARADRLLALAKGDTGWRTMPNVVRIKFGAGGKIEAGPSHMIGRRLQDVKRGAKAAVDTSRMASGYHVTVNEAGVRASGFQPEKHAETGYGGYGSFTTGTQPTSRGRCMARNGWPDT